MYPSRLATVIVAGSLLAPAAAVAADEAARLRLFLTDGTSLVSYGEFARVGDRVVFSMPTSATSDPPLQLVTLDAARVDWERTNRYAQSAREAHYLDGQADVDFAVLSNQVAQTLNAVSASADAATRLRLVEDARRVLADWPQNHFNFKQAEVRQMVAMLEEAIADIKASTGMRRFDLSLAAFAQPAGTVEPLLPPPTPQEAIQEVLTAARIADSPAERTALLSAALTSLDRDKAALSSEWVAVTRTETDALIAVERRVDRSYQSLTKRMLAIADRRVRVADVRGLERLLARVHENDKALGGRRPDAVSTLISAVEVRLDAARRLRLARDRWELRAPVLREYRGAIGTSMDLFAQMKPSLESIKSLAGTSPGALTALQRAVEGIAAQVAIIVPPDELRAAHALLISAVQLAGNAGRIRREATLAGDIARAWDASSAAAGALMLGARARTDIQDALRPPQLR